MLAGEACLYSVIKRSALSLGWKLIGEDASERSRRNCHVIWVDRSFANDKLFLSLQPWQRINHFPGMTNICRKARLAQSLELMRKQFPREFSFYPATYVLPASHATFRTLFATPSGRSRSTYIIKPDGSAQGKGIFLTRRIEDVENLREVYVAQQYIRNPLLIDRKKFDLRIYVLVTSCDPLRAYLFRDGLVRICTEEYKRPNTSNMDDRCMHLTNYSVNKRSEKYERDDRGSVPSNLGSKRSIRWMLAWLGEEKSEAAANRMWSKIGDICAMTIISILPILRREYASVFEKNSAEPSTDCPASKPHGDETNANDDITGRSRCFEILGFDIMVDEDLRPSLIEVNQLPSWGTDSPVDEDIKSRVITQALSAISVNTQDKKDYENSKRKQSHLRLGRKQSTSVVSVDADDPPKGANSSTGKRPPALFDSNSAERRIRLVYEKHAPEKLGKVKDLLSRYRGYEEWLAMKVEEKYDKDDDESSAGSDDEDAGSSDEDSAQDPDEGERKKFEREERILEDYDRIYPPSSKNGRISPSRYREMEKFIAEMDEKQQRRLTCPLQQMRPAVDADNEFNTHGHFDRADGWIGGNIHARPPAKEEQAKILGPPTKKQIESADRLSRGYSVEDDEVGEKSVQKKSRTLHNDYFHEEDNPFYHLIADRVRQSREKSKEARKRAEKKLRNRSSKSGTLLRQQVLQLGLEIPFIEMEENSKFYTKRKESDDLKI